MAAAKFNNVLHTGISYGLSQSNINENKEVIFVKLTDSAYRAIEDYQKNQNKLSSHPTIQFVGNEGYLSFPSLSNNGGQKFSFSISETEGLQGSFNCIQQNHNQLDVLGSLTNKMRIHANEDVYEATRHRMAVVEETQKNKCTREIKPNQTDIGRKVKVKPSINRLSNIPNSNTLNKRDSSSTSNSLNNIVNNNHNSLTTTQSLKNNNISNPMQQHQPLYNQLQQQNTLTTSTPLQSTTNNTSSTSTISTTSNSNVNNSHTTTGSSMPLSAAGGSVPSRVASSRNQNTASRGNTEIMKRPIKERLIHLLALRPFKKPELYARINSEGIREKERPHIGTLLKSISFLRDNTYNLNRHIWNDVHEDWPFYTEQDRQILKRRKPQNLTPPLSSDGGSSTSGQSPTSTHNGSPPPAVKRPSLNNDKYSSEGGPPSKKQRISHFKKDVVNQDNNRRSAVDSRDSANLNPRSREYDGNPMRSSSHYGSSIAPAGLDSEDNGLSLNFTVLNSEAAKRISSTSMPISDHDQERDRYDEQTKNVRKQANDKPNAPVYDFSRYTRITSIEQRRQYKGEFDKDYAEYRRLHAHTDQISKKFTELEEELRQVSNDELLHKVGRSSSTPVVMKKDIQRKIISEFQRTMSDSQIQEDKERFQYLHKKLSHIKQLVHDFDKSLIFNGIQMEQENY